MTEQTTIKTFLNSKPELRWLAKEKHMTPLELLEDAVDEYRRFSNFMAITTEQESATA